MDIHRKVGQYKGFIIAKDNDEVLYIYTTDEWSYGHGYRYAEFEVGYSIREAFDFIDSYKKGAGLQ